jgi:DNA-binding NarL/FixJ family response regulator
MESCKLKSEEDILEENRPYIEFMSRVNNSLVWIIDRATGTCLYLSPNFKDILGCDPSELGKSQPLDFLLRYIHPDDLPILTGAQNRFFDFISNLTYEEQGYYKHIFEFRLLHKGAYIRVTDQRRLLGISSGNAPVILGIVDISPDQAPEKAVNSRLVNIKTMDAVPFPGFSGNECFSPSPGPDAGNYTVMDAGSILKRYKTYIDLLTGCGSCCVYVIEKKTDTFLYMSPNFHDIWGYDSSELRQRQSGKYLVRHIHPDDIAAFSCIQDRILEFISDLPAEERMCCKYVFELRSQHKGKWLRIMSKHLLLGISSDYGPLVLGIIEISPNQTSTQPVSYRLTNTKTGDTILLSENGGPDITLTKREQEILKLVNEGLFSKEIADRLSISIHTVNGYKQKILQKMHVNNQIEAINLARNRGYLP